MKINCFAARNMKKEEEESLPKQCENVHAAVRVSLRHSNDAFPPIVSRVNKESTGGAGNDWCCFRCP